jgi:threonine dehydrogenase-like Zn-dependent dehydrogenase
MHWTGIHPAPACPSSSRRGRVDLSPMVTHRFKLDDVEQGCDLFGHQRDGVLKVAITP